MLLIVILASDYLIGVIGDSVVVKLNEKNYVGDAALLNYSLNKICPDILIVGSSTALSHYNPTTFEDSLSNRSHDRLQCFNAGASTQGLPYAYALVKSVFERKIPKYVILDIIPLQLCQTFSSEQQSRLRPFVKTNKYVSEIFVENASYKENLLLKSNLYCYNTELTKLCLSFFKPTGSNGFYKHETHLENTPERIVENSDLDFNENAIKYLNSIIALCNKNKVALIIAVSPCLNHEYTSRKQLDYLEDICLKNKVCFVNCLNDKDFQRNEYFHDQRHLSVEGANKYTQKVIQDIQ